jgi:DNA-binding NarL/FixJ family response regulator
MSARRAAALDAAIVLVGAVLTASHFRSDPIPGPRWLVAGLPLLLDLPLLWRRHHPLAVLCAVMCGVLLQAVVSGNSAEGVELIFALTVAVYSAAAYSPRGRAVAALAVAVTGYGVYASHDRNIRSGAGEELWAGAFFAVYLVAVWGVGVSVRGRREAAALRRQARMPVLDGIEATARLVRAGGRARVPMLTTFDLDEYVHRAMKAGASGFLLKDARREQLAAAVRTVAAGDALLAASITRRLIADFCRRPPPGGRPEATGELSARELIARGLSNAEIAQELYLSEATVKSHVARILAKLRLRDRVQTVVFAYESGVVRAGER